MGKRRRRLRDLHAPPFSCQPFRFGGLFGIAAPLTMKGETGAALADLAVFGLRASLLPRRWDLAISFSCWRRLTSQPLGAPLRRTGFLAPAASFGMDPEFAIDREYSPPAAAAAKLCTSTYRLYIDSLCEETRLRSFCRANARRAFRGCFSEQEPSVI
jgi:hypothetical protein